MRAQLATGEMPQVPCFKKIYPERTVGPKTIKKTYPTVLKFVARCRIEKNIQENPAFNRAHVTVKDPAFRVP
jgi:hypothetical protein